MANRPFGIENNSSNCYFNSLLQCLYTFPELMTFTRSNTMKGLSREFQLSLIQIKHYNTCDEEKCNVEFILKDCSNNILNYLRQNNTLFGRGQEDCQEAFIYLMNDLINDPNFENLKNLFTIRSSSTISCTNCNHHIIHEDTQYNLFMTNFHNLSDGSVEILEDYKCDKCSEKTCTKIDRIEKTSKILPVYLKNIYSNIVSSSYPRFITINEKYYELVSQIIHFGNLKCGHYVSQCKRGNKAYNFNDRVYKEIDQLSIDKHSCFLFYRQIATV